MHPLANESSAVFLSVCPYGPSLLVLTYQYIRQTPSSATLPRRRTKNEWTVNGPSLVDLVHLNPDPGVYISHSLATLLSVCLVKCWLFGWLYAVSLSIVIVVGCSSICDTEAEHPTNNGNNNVGHQFISFTVPNHLPSTQHSRPVDHKTDIVFGQRRRSIGIRWWYRIGNYQEVHGLIYFWCGPPLMANIYPIYSVSIYIPRNLWAIILWTRTWTWRSSTTIYRPHTEWSIGSWCPNRRR